MERIVEEMNNAINDKKTNLWLVFLIIYTNWKIEYYIPDLLVIQDNRHLKRIERIKVISIHSSGYFLNQPSERQNPDLTAPRAQFGDCPPGIAVISCKK